MKIEDTQDLIDTVFNMLESQDRINCTVADTFDVQQAIIKNMLEVMKNQHEIVKILAKKIKYLEEDIITREEGY